MERRREEDVDGWPTRPIDGGYDGLRQLAAADFSGAVRARGTTLFMLNGRIVGVFDGTIEDFDGASGTAHKAPHPSLPLLYAMQETGGETRGKYYTNDTPISEVDQTLSEGSFTGYVELSENVLSGDYYSVYHAGRAMSVAFVGTSERLLTGDEAFQRADDEVGIYEVRDVDLDVRDVPREDDGDESEEETEATDDEGAAGRDGADGRRETDESGGTSSEENGGASGATSGGTSERETARETADDSDAVDRSQPADRSDAGDSETEAEASAAGGAADGRDAGGDAGAAGAAGTGTAAGVEEAAPEATSTAQSTTDSDPDVDARDGEPPDDAAEAPIDEAEPSRDAGSADGADGTPRSTGSDQVQSAASSAEPTADETTASAEQESGSDAPVGAGGSADSVPDPQRAEPVAAEPSAGANGASVERGPAGGDVAGESTETAERPSLDDAIVVPSLDPDRSTEPSVTAQSDATSGTEPDVDGRSTEPDVAVETPQRSGDGVDAAFDQEILEREDHIDRLQQRVSNLQEERDDVAAERNRLAERVDELETENEELQAQLRQLEREIEELEAGGGDGSVEAAVEQEGPVELGPRAALEATDLFVRSDSKGRPTLDDVPDGAAASEVNDNLRLDLHTRFDADEATVDGQPYREFLEDTMAYRFVDWLVRELPYEIRDTGQEAAMRDCYDALPEVDRVEFHGAVELTYEEEGQTVQAEEPFDVVVRDRMGETLFVANLNDSRDPANGGMLLDLQSGATRVKEYTNVLAGAFAVTRSFFDPDALETADEATSGSLLSRDSRKSYVKVSRKSGYHLCLVEAREGNLHLNVPEL